METENKNYKYILIINRWLPTACKILKIEVPIKTESIKKNWLLRLKSVVLKYLKLNN